MVEVTGFCAACQDRVLFRRREANHLFHFLFSALTFGLWIPFWLVLSLKKTRWRCSQCGSALTPQAEEGLDLPAEAKKPWIVRHFRGYRALEPWPFCWRISLEGLTASALAAILLSTWLPGPDRDLEESPGLFFLAAVLIAPAVETLIFQGLVIFLLRLCRAPMALQIAISVALFAAAHFWSNGPANGISAGLIGGFYFAFTYAHWAERSHWTAIWITAFSHALLNGIVFSLFLFARD
ncbi:MAG: CPBP family intramembrane metalloprotease [Planctomycetes bacterium]|nr:CPBP family intramembrane metalloprotease [Planctomycetota bacterium]